MSEQTTRRPITPEDYFRLEYITEARLSPDAKKLAYGVMHYDPKKDEDCTALWLLDLESGENRQLTGGEHVDCSFAWSPDGKKIAFTSTRVEPAQVFVLPMDGGEALQLTSGKAGVAEGPHWSPDGRFIAFTAPDPEDEINRSLPYRVTRHIYRFDRLGYLGEKLTDLYVIPAGGGEPRRLTDDNCMNSGPTWSPDGQEILFIATHHPDTFHLHGVLKTVDMKGDVITLVDEGWGSAHSAEWMPNGKICFSGQVKESKMGHKTDLWVIPRRGGTPQCRTDGLIGEVNGGPQDDIPVRLTSRTMISPDCQTAIARVEKGGYTQIWQIALSGPEDCRPLVQADASIFPMGMTDSQFIYLATAWNDPTNLYRCGRNGENIEKLTHLNESLLGDLLQPEVQNLHFKGCDGVEIEGWLMKPVIGQAPYPTVLNIHGGPTGCYGNAYAFDYQMLAGAGYAVLFINPQGSTGYGNDFGTSLNLRWGEIDYVDQMAALNHVIELGLTNPDKLGIYGLSYGGYMTCWMITQTDRFKAAISENPVSDLASDCGVGDLSVWMNLDALGGMPYEVPQMYDKASPVTFAHRVKTPTLMLQGECDYRCPALNTEQFYTMLKVNKCIVEMVRLPGSSHAESIGGKPIIRRAQNEELLAWMKKYNPVGE